MSAARRRLVFNGGEYLGLWMKMLKYTQVKLAEELKNRGYKLYQTDISNLKKGLYAPSPMLLINIAQILNMDLNEWAAVSTDVATNLKMYDTYIKNGGRS